MTVTVGSHSLRHRSGRAAPVIGARSHAPEAVGRIGYGVISGFAGSSQRLALIAAADRCSYAAAKETVGPVRQRAEQATIYAVDHWGEVVTLASQVEALLADVMPAWRPNEATFTWYRGGDAGLSAHRDSRRYVGAVAVLTLVGEADVEILAGRSGPITCRWRARPGDLLLLRGWSDHPTGDPRPFHRVGSPIGGNRLILALRQQAELDAPFAASGSVNSSASIDPVKPVR